MKNGDKPYFTGDEVDWKPREPLFGTAFVFAKEERDQIARILWPTMQEQIDRATAQLEAMTPEQLAALDEVAEARLAECRKKMDGPAS